MIVQTDDPGNHGVSRAVDDPGPGRHADLVGGPDGMTVPEQLTAIHDRAATLVKDQYELLNQLVFPALAAEGIHFVNAKTFTAQQRQWVGEYFAKEVEPVLTPFDRVSALAFGAAASVTLIDVAVEKAKTLAVPIRPVMVNGELVRDGCNHPFRAPLLLRFQLAQGLCDASAEVGSRAVFSGC